MIAEASCLSGLQLSDGLCSGAVSSSSRFGSLVTRLVSLGEMVKEEFPSILKDLMMTVALDSESARCNARRLAVLKDLLMAAAPDSELAQCNIRRLASIFYGTPQNMPQSQRNLLSSLDPYEEV